MQPIQVVEKPIEHKIILVFIIVIVSKNIDIDHVPTFTEVGVLSVMLQKALARLRVVMLQQAFTSHRFYISRKQLLSVPGFMDCCFTADELVSYVAFTTL
jgi:hypothetical protein